MTTRLNRQHDTIPGRRSLALPGSLSRRLKHARGLFMSGTKQFMSGHKSLMSGHKLLMSGHKSLMSGHKPFMSGHKLLMSGHKSLMSGHKSLMSGHKSLMSGHKSLMSGHEFLMSGHKPLVSRSICFPRVEIHLARVHHTPARGTGTRSRFPGFSPVTETINPALARVSSRRERAIR